ncbi:hypothetical protein CsSME_00036058 [Camellia sinensis var. sinensis]
MDWGIEKRFDRYHCTVNVCVIHHLLVVQVLAEKAKGEILLASVFQKRLPPEAVDLLTIVSVVVLQLETCIHLFFDELRDPNTCLPNGRPLPPLFNFKPQATKQGQWRECPTSLCPLFENVGGWGL